MDETMKKLVIKKISLRKGRNIFCKHNSVDACADCRKKILGNVSGISGNVSGISGNVSGISGNVSEILEILEKNLEEKNGIKK